MLYKPWHKRLRERIVVALAKIKWTQKSELTTADKDFIHNLLASDYYLIATRRGNYLTTFFIGLGGLLTSFKWSRYSHVLMNLENDVHDRGDFRLIEATMKGTGYSTFDQVFHDVDSVALMRPKYVSVKEWTAALDASKTYLGVPYDSLFDVKNAAEVNCVELVWRAIQTIPGYEQKFPHLTYLVNKHPTLTPEMFVSNTDFEVCYEKRSR